MIQPQTCAVCDKSLDVTSPGSSELFPFCSERCRNIDLYRWCQGTYAITQQLDLEQMPVERPAEEDEG